MSPTTSVRYVNLCLHPSGLARFIALALNLHISVVILASPLPLVITFLLIGYLFAGWPGAMVQQQCGELRLMPDRQLQWQGRQEGIAHAGLRYRPLQIQIKCASGRQLVIWRDAVSEAEYRHLLVWLDGRTDS